MAVFCCVECRLLQAPTTACIDCGTGMVAPFDLVRELLGYRDLHIARGRDWAFITALLAGSSIAFPMLLPVAFGGAVVAAIDKLTSRRRRSIQGVMLAPPSLVRGAVTRVGTPRRLRSTVPSIVDGAPVLFEQALVRARDGSVLLRRADVAPFVLDTDAGPMLVEGPARLLGEGTRVRVKTGDPRLARMGVPADVAVTGSLETAHITEVGRISVTGLIDDDAVAELAFHRDGGAVPVMRGAVGAPVLVESEPG